jgi:hypothetical protein
MPDVLSSHSYKFRYTGGPFPVPAPEVEDDAILFDHVLDEIRGLFRERNNIYRSRFRQQGTGGILSWIGVKMQRLSSLLAQGAGPDEDEDVTENLLDIAVYAALGALMNYYGQQESTPCRHLYAVDESSHGSGDLHCLLCGDKSRLATIHEQPLDVSHS